MIKKISVVLSLILSFCAILTIINAIDNYYAKSSALALVAQDLRDTKDLIRYKSVQERVWQLDGYYQNKQMPDPVKNQYRDLQQELKEIEQRMKKK
jgi:hypothetical protein